MELKLKLTGCSVRSWRESDAERLAQHANNRKVWRNLRDGFPYPYRLEHARAFLAKVAAMAPETFFAIAVDCPERSDEAVGGIGFSIHQDVERLSAEIGYWLGEPFWGRGIATQALKAVTRYAIETHGLVRLFATPYAWNPASCRVLEKAGYQLEGRMRRAVIKDGKIIDQLLYALVVGAD